MKIEINNENHIVQNAFYDLDYGYPSVLIETREKWVLPDGILHQKHPEEFMEFSFNIYNETADKDYVRLVPETTKEKEILNGIRFLNHNKDQLWYIFLPFEKDHCLNTLSSVFELANKIRETEDTDVMYLLENLLSEIEELEAFVS